MKKVTFDEMAKRYCDLQLQTPSDLLEILKKQKERYNPKGFFLAECQVFDSSRAGSLVILPFGGQDNTFQEIPTSPFSPRGLASDMSVAVEYCDADLPESAAPWDMPMPDKMTKEEKEEARHALGLPNKQKTSFRNHFCTEESNSLWSGLVKKGLATMRRADTLPFGGAALFYLTPLGARLALNKGEKLSADWGKNDKITPKEVYDKAIGIVDKLLENSSSFDLSVYLDDLKKKDPILHGIVKQILKERNNVSAT